MKEMIGRIFRLTLVLGIVVAISCKSGADNYKIENVVRVFMHEPDLYTFGVQNPESSEVRMITMKCYDGVKIFTDVPADKRMWVEVFRTGNGWESNRYRIEIHVYSEKNIEGGGWDHGKFGKGTTQVIK